MKITNCVNCGARLQSNICEYCGSVYEKKEIKKYYYEDNIKLVNQEGDRKITLNIYGKDIDFYIANITSRSIPTFDEIQWLDGSHSYCMSRPDSRDNIEITLISC